MVAHDPEKALVDLEDFAPEIKLDIRYATPNNFMGRPLYPATKAFLRCPAARALRQAQAELEKEGLGLKIFDAYRPYGVTVAMWEQVRNPDYVADPAKGSRHNRGAAVDVTLVDLRTGAEVPMPTAYDDFTPRAAHGFADLPPHIIRHRAVLREAMERHGFEALPSEWWHYDFRGWDRFEILDLSHRELERGTPMACPVKSAER